jgi:hypothetical protein
MQVGVPFFKCGLVETTSKADTESEPATSNNNQQHEREYQGAK